jgi:hypothetical protein
MEAISTDSKKVKKARRIRFHGTFLTRLLKQKRKQAMKRVHEKHTQYIHL